MHNITKLSIITWVCFILFIPFLVETEPDIKAVNSTLLPVATDSSLLQLSSHSFPLPGLPASSHNLSQNRGIWECRLPAVRIYNSKVLMSSLKQRQEHHLPIQNKLEENQQQTQSWTFMILVEVKMVQGKWSPPCTTLARLSPWVKQLSWHTARGVVPLIFQCKHFKELSRGPQKKEYSQLPIIRTFKGNGKKFELSKVQLYRK